MDETSQTILALTKQFLIEMEAQRAVRSLNLNSALDRDLGIDSLGRVELFSRIEQSLDISLPAESITAASTISEIVKLAKQLQPKVTAAHRELAASLAPSHYDPTKANTLIEVLAGYAKSEPTRPHIYLQAGDTEDEVIITYAELYQRAQHMARGLRSHGVKRGDTVAIMLPTSANFFYSFFGALLAGAVPVPIYPPFRVDQIEEYAKREAKILRNAEVRILITFHAAERLSNILKDFIPSLLGVYKAPALMLAEGEDLIPELESSDSALIQYTSGSTGAPKGVLLSHQNLLTNLRCAGAAINVKPDDRIVTWLPLYHDMGLIGTWLGSLYFGVPVTILSPLSFLLHPAKWLWAIHYHRATISAAPNFAYELCIKRIKESEIHGIDLSSWRLAFNGAEAIYPNTIREFIKKFKPHGFNETAMYPVYGLAENSVALCFPGLGKPVKYDRIARNAFQNEQVAVNMAAGGDLNNGNCLEFVCVGKPIVQHDIRIVDRFQQVMPERHIGAIQFRGPSAMQGYFHNPEATEQIIHDGWLDTGDLGYLADDELYITGRSKDMIIKAGRNIYPAEVEDITATIDGVRKGCVAAFGSTDASSGTEKLIVVAETRVETEAKRSTMHTAIRELVTDAIGIPPDDIVLTSPHSVPKTSSGKLRRADCKNLYETGKLGKKQMPVWLQVSRLYITSFANKFTNTINQCLKYIYKMYSYACFGLLLPLLWAACKVLPRDKALRFNKYWNRSLMFILGCPLKVKKLAESNKQQAVIYVANHASYIDTFVLAGVLPEKTLFVGKKELLQLPLLGPIIKKLGHIMVDRLDFSKSLESLTEVKNALENNYNVMIFPEGTLAYATGLRPFKLGAYNVAVATNTPILPVALRGTRTILRYSCLPRPAVVTITFGKPINLQAEKSDAERTEFKQIMQLRNASKLFIAKHSGEKNLDIVVGGIEGVAPSPRN